MKYRLLSLHSTLTLAWPYQIYLCAVKKRRGQTIIPTPDWAWVGVCALYTQYSYEDSSYTLNWASWLCNPAVMTCWMTQVIFTGSYLYLLVGLPLSLCLTHLVILLCVCGCSCSLYLFVIWYFKGWNKVSKDSWPEKAKMLPLFSFIMLCYAEFDFWKIHQKNQF